MQGNIKGHHIRFTEFRNGILQGLQAISAPQGIYGVVLQITVPALDDKIIPYITNICKRDPRSGKVVTGGIVSCQDSKWLMSWTINRQGQFKEQDKNQVCVWVYGLFTDVPGDYIKKPMKDCTGKEITEEWLYHLGVPVEDIEDLAEHSAVCVPTMMPYITAFFMPRTKGDRPDVIPDGCVNFAFLGQFAETPRDTVFTTEYSVRTAMEAVYGLLGVDRGVPEVWGSVYDIRELLDSSVKLMDGMSPLEIELPGPLNGIKVRRLPSEKSGGSFLKIIQRKLNKCKRLHNTKVLYKTNKNGMSVFNIVHENRYSVKKLSISS